MTSPSDDQAQTGATAATPPPDKKAPAPARKKRTWKGWAWRIALGVGLVGLVVGGLTAVIGYWYFSRDLPDVPELDEYWPPILSEVYTADGVLAGEFFEERRKVIPYERIPKRLVQAFIASEDASFFDHGGIDLIGTSRAAFKTIRRKITGSGSIQGGSSLTQQTAKAVLISAEGYESATAKNLVRKIREAIIALRLEERYTKEEILYLYLNNVYLGHHSYGVQSAAENYFRKDVRELTLGQMTLIAGLPQAPSRYSPWLNPEAAKRRRSYVVRQMLEKGMITQEEHDTAVNEPVSVYPVENVFREFAPYFSEHVRRDVVERFGNPALLREGLRIFTTMDSERQRAAQDAMLSGLLIVDKRQGYRGPLTQLESEKDRAAFLETAKKAVGDAPLQLGSLYVGLVTAIDSDRKGADVQVGKYKGKLPLLGMRWARPVNPTGYYPGLMLSDVRRAVSVGDVVVLRHVEAEDLYDDREQFDRGLRDAATKLDVPLFRLEQEPELQGALVSIDPHRNYLTAMVGGYDFEANEYNRAFQACRQPGSAYKPVVYAAALELLDYTQATVLVDSPIVFDDPDSQLRWKPDNYGQDFEGDVLLRSALVRSLNIPAVKTFQAVGVKEMHGFHKHLGFTTPMNEDFSAALGSSCVYPYELAGVYATFNRQGIKKAPVWVRKVEDRFGRTLEDHTAYDDAWAPLLDRIGGAYALQFEKGEQVMGPENAWLLGEMLRGVVREGTGAHAQRLRKPAAGKTGTTNDSFDTWFAGYTRDLVTVVWMGYDLNQHPLSRFETGGRASLPIWVEYMQKALDGRPQPEFRPREELNLKQVSVDAKTGRLASSGSASSVRLWFRPDTIPEDAEPEQGVVDPSSFMQLPY